MGVTISTHNRSSVARGHNIRKANIVSKEKHIDPNGVYEIWHDEHPRDAYERIFGKAVEEYNAKQKRADRRIKDYYNTIREDKARKCVYEMIIGVYGKNEDGTSKCPRDIGYAILKEFVDDWKVRNPNLELIGAYYHADEPDAEPHVHIDYVPKAHGYTNGMSVQNGLVKALGEMGFTKKNKATAQILWEKSENEYLESLCNRYGFEVEHPQAGKGAKHLNTETYKAKTELKKVKEELENTRKSALDVLHKRQEIETDYQNKKSDYDVLVNSFNRKQKEQEELDKSMAEKKNRLANISNALATESSNLAQIRLDKEMLEEECNKLKKEKTGAELKVLQLNNKVEALENKYKAMEEAPPEQKIEYINEDYKELAEIYCHAFESMQKQSTEEQLEAYDKALGKNEDYATACSRLNRGMSL